MADDHHRLPANRSKAANHRLIVAYIPVAVKFNEIIADEVDIIEGLGSIGMTRHLYLLPARHIIIDVVPGFFQFILQFRQGSTHVYICLFGYLVYLLNLNKYII